MDLRARSTVESTALHPGDDNTVAIVAALFAKVLDLESVEPGDDFFRLGGDSLIAATLTIELEREFGVRLSISALIEAATPRALAPVVLEARSQNVGSVLIAAKAAGHGTPLICVHGQGGESMFPRKISRALQSDRPVYAFRAMGLEADERPLSSVSAMASYYLAAVKQKIQQTGPYLLLGHCSGSLIAYEMAQQLSLAGETVAGLVMIDPPGHPKLSPFLHKSGIELQREQMAWTKRAAQIEAEFAAMSDPNVGDRRRVVRELMNAAAVRYVPAQFSRPTLFIHSSQRRTALLRGYPPLLRNCEFVEIQGDHLKLFNERLDEVASRIDLFVDRVCPPN